MTSFEYFSSLLYYQKASGMLFWKHPKQGRTLGKEAGNLDAQGYKRVMVDGIHYRTSRVVWLLNTKKWPTGVIDHIDRNKSNDKFENLRDTNQQVNCNNRGINKNNKSGTTGVYRTKNGRWSVVRRAKYLGTFTELSDAKAAYDNAK